MTADHIPFIKDNVELVLDAMPEEYQTPFFMHTSEQMPQIEDESVDLIVTSPPYPMVEMWDEFGSYNEQHEMLNNVFTEAYKKLKRGGMMCVNIGDATRNLSGDFRYYPNHSRVHTICEEIGYTPLIPVLWRKPTNKPNSFMGSGMKPPNAYVTNEVEYILIFRKGPPRKFGSATEEILRDASAYSQEQRNKWFSQIWDIPGADQDDDRAQFPFEIPYRLIRMFSTLGDTVMDPFAGTGTTLMAARATGRHAVGYEIKDELRDDIIDKLSKVGGIDNRDILRNVVRVDRDGVGSDAFYKNPTPLIDIIE